MAQKLIFRPKRKAKIGFSPCVDFERSELELAGIGTLLNGYESDRLGLHNVSRKFEAQRTAPLDAGPRKVPESWFFEVGQKQGFLDILADFSANSLKTHHQKGGWASRPHLG